MKRRSFLKLLGSASVSALLPVSTLPVLPESAEQPTPPTSEAPYTSEQLAALEKIEYYEAQLGQFNYFSWHAHNELRHYWGAFSEAKSLFYANRILENSIMDAYIMNTLSDWHYVPAQKFDQPDQAMLSLQRRAESYPELHYLRVACWLKMGEISNAIGNKTLAKRYYQHVVDLSEKLKQQSSRLSIYQQQAQVQLSNKV